MTLESLVAAYGYPVILLGTFLEGETVLILGGFAAHRGYLALPWVIGCAFLGTLAGDQLYYYLGRWKGNDLLARRPHWESKSRRVAALLERHQVLLILGFRFLYGLRTVTPFLIGLSGVPPLRFLALNGVGAFAWAAVTGSLGYVFGQALELMVERVERYEWMAVAGIVLIGTIAWSRRWWLDRRAASAPDA